MTTSDGLRAAMKRKASLSGGEVDPSESRLLRAMRGHSKTADKTDAVGQDISTAEEMDAGPKARSDSLGRRSGPAS